MLRCLLDWISSPSVQQAKGRVQGPAFCRCRDLATLRPESGSGWAWTERKMVIFLWGTLRQGTGRLGEGLDVLTDGTIKCREEMVLNNGVSEPAEHSRHLRTPTHALESFIAPQPSVCSRGGGLSRTTLWSDPGASVYAEGVLVWVTNYWVPLVAGDSFLVRKDQE